MTILWGGSEVEAFDSSALAALTGAGDRDADFARAAISINTGTLQRCNKVAFGSIAEAWFHYRWGGQNTGSETNARTLIQFTTSGGQGILRYQQVGSGDKRLQYWSGSAWTDIGASTNPTTANGRTFDMQCKIDGTTGSFLLYIDGVLGPTLTGNTNFFSASIDSVSVASWGNTNQRAFSEAIVSTTDSRGMRLATIFPNGSGATSDWTGTFADIDETTINDADFISSGTANQVSTFAVAALSATAAALSPVALIGSARVRNAVTGPQNDQLAVRTGGANFFSSNLPSIGTSFVNGYQYVWGLNPNTGLDWTTTELSAIEIGDKSIT